jgi:hypothetical protein
MVIGIYQVAVRMRNDIYTNHQYGVRELNRGDVRKLCPEVCDLRRKLLGSSRTIANKIKASSICSFLNDPRSIFRETLSQY